ncbi:MAG: hypothetical protein HY055_15940, partial [Magnetospirillum sp.]|nr:hypothetical protein [Magnetospirillum sp.]
MFAKITALTLLSLVLLGPGAASRAEDAPLATVVLFDSVCLTCHEGECSGRLALREGHSPSGLAGHVAGYAGAQPDKTVSQLRDLMGRLKTQCRLPPPPLAVPADGV